MRLSFAVAIIGFSIWAEYIIHDRNVRSDESMKRAAELNHLYKTSQVGLCLMDREFRYLRINQKLAEINGFTIEEHLGRTVREMVPDIGESLERRFQRILETGEPAIGGPEDRFVTGVGKTRRHLVADYYPLKTDDGGVWAINAIIRDVTEHKLAEQALLESEGRFQKAVEEAPFPVMIHAEDGTVVMTNHVWTELTGYEAEEMPTISAWTELAYNEKTGDVLARIDKLYEIGGRVREGEYEPVTKSGERLVWDFSSTPLGLSSEGKRLVLSIAMDVTERKRAELAIQLANEELEERVDERTGELFAANERLIEEIREREATHEALVASEATMKAVVGGAAEGVITINEDGIVESFNAAASSIFDYAEKEVIGQNINILMPEAFRIAHDEHLKRYLETDEKHVLCSTREVEGRHSDGTTFPIDISVSEVELPNRRIFMGIMRDATERKTAEAERMRLEMQVQHGQKLESLGVMAGGIAHDFNNLLTGVIGNADLAAQNLPEGSPVLDRLHDIEMAARSMAELSQQMLAFSGKGQFVVASINLSQLVEEMSVLLGSAVSKKIVFTKELDPMVPIIEADPSQIKQVVMNLITNASEALGEEAGTITLKTSRTILCEASPQGDYIDHILGEGEYARLEVSDTGCGMDEETREKIFDPFFSTKFTGRGLGLAAVLGIVQGHRGALSIESNLGQGTTFTVLLPASARPPAQADRPEAATSKENLIGRGRTILVADDEPMVLSFACRILELSGFNFLTAVNGREAVEIFESRSSRISLVLLDLTMPVLDGWEALAEIRQIQADVPIILSSGYSEEQVAENMSSIEMTRFVQKPYLPSQLLEKIGALIEPE